MGEGGWQDLRETRLRSWGEVLLWTGSLGRGEAGTEEMGSIVGRAWGAPYRDPTPSVLPRQECDSSLPSPTPPTRAHWQAVWPRALPSPSLSPVSKSPGPAHTAPPPPRVVKRLTEGDRGDNPVLGTTSALQPREEGGEAGESVSAGGGGQNRTGRRSAGDPSFLTPTPKKSDSLSKAGTGEERSLRP